MIGPLPKHVDPQPCLCHSEFSEGVARMRWHVRNVPDGGRTRWADAIDSPCCCKRVVNYSSVIPEWISNSCA